MVALMKVMTLLFLDVHVHSVWHCCFVIVVMADDAVVLDWLIENVFVGVVSWLMVSLCEASSELSVSAISVVVITVATVMEIAVMVALRISMGQRGQDGVLLDLNWGHIVSIVILVLQLWVGDLEPLSRVVVAMMLTVSVVRAGIVVISSLVLMMGHHMLNLAMDISFMMRSLMMVVLMAVITNVAILMPPEVMRLAHVAWHIVVVLTVVWVVHTTVLVMSTLAMSMLIGSLLVVEVGERLVMLISVEVGLVGVGVPSGLVMRHLILMVSVCMMSIMTIMMGQQAVVLMISMVIMMSETKSVMVLMVGHSVLSLMMSDHFVVLLVRW